VPGSRLTGKRLTGSRVASLLPADFGEHFDRRLPIEQRAERAEQLLMRALVPCASTAA
jgi:hypothetical protein